MTIHFFQLLKFKLNNIYYTQKMSLNQKITMESKI